MLDVRDEASVAAYQRDAAAAVDEIVARGRVPLLVGGSGLYVAAVLDGLEFPGTDPELRARLEAELAEPGPQRSPRPAGRASTPLPRRRSCPATAAGSCVRSRWSS